MSVQIKSLTNGSPVKDTSPAVANDTFNLIPTKDEYYDLYSAPTPTAANPTIVKKAAIVKGIRVVNTGSVNTQVSLYFNRPTSSAPNAPSRRRLLAPGNILLAPGFAYIDEGEITLEPGDKIQAKADTANVIHYVISGVERDVV
jgi:hypothetical protein